jgi:hypothetical protein
MTTEREHVRTPPPHPATASPPEGKAEGKAGKGKAVPPDDDAVKLPTLREMEEELGDKEGSIRLDVNLETGEARKVRVDAKGKESK